jgi:L-rhamnose isomerase
MSNDNNKRKGIRDFPTHEKNPFINNLLIPKRARSTSISRKPLKLADTETGEILDQELFIHQRKEVDKKEFVKVFNEHIATIFNLSSRALKLFGYIMESLKMNNDTFYLDQKKCMKYTNYSSATTLSFAIAELIDKEIIARADNINLYYVNPSIVWNGDRLVFIKDYHKKEDIKRVNKSGLFEKDEIQSNSKS